MTKKLLTIALLCLACASVSRAQTTAASCNDHGGTHGNDVQFAINATAAGGTVIVPAGTCTWTAGVTITGGQTLQGAGSARVIARDNGTDMITIPSAFPTGVTFHIAWYHPGFSQASITPGQTLLIFQLGADLAASANPQSYMQGTVTSFTKGAQTCILGAGVNVGADTPCSDTLVMSITSSGTTAFGAGPWHRWEIATVNGSGTTLVNSVPNSGQMFNVTENTSFDANIFGFHIVPGTIQQRIMNMNYTTNGLPILFHDNWIRGDVLDLPHGTNDDSTMIEGNTTRGVFWNNTFESTTGIAPTCPTNSPVCCPSGQPSCRYDTAGMAAVVVKDNNNSIQAWTNPSYWGTADTTGTNNLYCETNTFLAMGSSCDGDDNARMVMRYNMYDNSGEESHGADSSHIGQRYTETYESVFIKDSYNNSTGGATLNNPQFYYVRGGSFVFHHNYIPPYTGVQFGTQTNINYTVMNLQRDSGFNACWGANPTNGGQFYYAPRQVGMGRVTGTGTTNYNVAPVSCNHCTFDSGGFYVGDSEPAYIWQNNNSAAALPKVGPSDYGINTTPSGCAHDGVPTSSSTYDSTANYVALSRDLFNNGTAKPSYTPYTYPHPSRRRTPQSLAPSCTPTSGVVPQTITCTNPNVGTTVMCYTVVPTNPATNGLGTGCTTGTKYTGIISISSAGTLNVIAGVASESDSFISSYTYSSPSAVPPTVTTTLATSITATSATSGGTVTATGGASVTSEGVCYATTSNPTTPCTSDGTATPFTSSLTGLSPGTTYFYRAFATNSAGTGYGGNMSFGTPSGCSAPIPIGIYTICNSGYTDVGSGTLSTVTLSPTAGNGILAYVSFCSPSACGVAPPVTTITMYDNLNNPETCFTAAPHSPYSVVNTNVPDYETLAAFYCPSIPSGVTSFTAKTGTSVNFLQLDIVEIQAGQIVATSFFEPVDQLTASGATANQLALVPTSGATTNATDLVVSLVATCGLISANVGAGYTGIIVNPASTPGHIVEAQAVSIVQNPSVTASTTWSMGTPRGNCGLGAGGSNDTWFGVITPLIGPLSGPLTEGAPTQKAVQ